MNPPHVVNASRVPTERLADFIRSHQPAPGARPLTPDPAPLTDEQLSELERLDRAATPGPWAWFGNTGMHEIHLATTHSGRIYVLKFRRWGMRGAQPMLQDRAAGIVRPASDFVRLERPYRKDIADVEHPDAQLLARFRAALPSLLAEVRRARAHQEPDRHA